MEVQVRTIRNNKMQNQNNKGANKNNGKNKNK